MLYKLRDTACQVYSQYQTGTQPTNADLASFKQLEEDLAIFGGQTNMVVSKLLSRKHRTVTKSPTTAPKQQEQPQEQQQTTATTLAASTSSVQTSPSPGVASPSSDGAPKEDPAWLEFMKALQASSSPSSSPFSPQSQAPSQSPTQMSPPQMTSHYIATPISDPSHMTVNQMAFSAGPQLPHVTLPSSSAANFIDQPSPPYYGVQTDASSGTAGSSPDSLGFTGSDSSMDVDFNSLLTGSQTEADRQWAAFMRDSGLYVAAVDSLA